MSHCTGKGLVVKCCLHNYYDDHTGVMYGRNNARVRNSMIELTVFAATPGDGEADVMSVNGTQLL